MIKRLICAFILLSALLLTSCGGTAAQPDENSDKKSDENINENTDEKLNENLDNIRFTYEFNGGETDIHYWADGGATYYYFLPSGNGLESLMVETQNGITLRKEAEPEEDRITFENGETLNGIECDTAYLLGCYDMNDYLYEVPVIFMQGANIHSVFITTDSGSIAPVLEDKDQKLKGDMLISDAEGNVVYQGGLTHIKGRGNGSWYSHKKPFNIKLSEKSDLLGMGTSREWCLINQETDDSCLRNKLAYDLAGDAGMAYTPDSEFVDLWIDGDYFGLYLLTDRITISKASVDITNLEEETEAVNMEKLSSYPLVMEDDKYGDGYSDIPNDPEDITGGYLLEMDKFYAEEKDARFHTERVYSMTLKSPEYLSKNQYDYISGYITEVEDAIADLNSTKYQNYIDIDSWISMCVIQEIMANTDFMGSSQYFYKETDSDGVYSKLYAGPVWDMDLSLGCETDNALPVNVLMLPTSSWVQYLYVRPEFYEGIVSVYANTYRPLVQEMLDSKIDLFADRISPSASMNFTRWKSVAGKKGITEPFLPSVEKLKEYLKERISFLDDLWIHNSQYHTVLVTTDEEIYAYEDLYYSYAYMVPDGEPLGELDEPLYVPEGYRFDGWYYGTPANPGEAFDLNAPVTEDCRVYAKYVPAAQE